MLQNQILYFFDEHQNPFRFIIMNDKDTFLKPFFTLLEIFIFCSKNSTLISRENCRLFWGEKLVKMLWFWTF